MQIHLLGVLVLTDFLAEFMQAVDWGQQVIWACRLLARVYPGLRQEGGNKRMEQPSGAGGICPYAILLCGEAIHPSSVRTASYPSVMLGTALGDTRFGSRELSRAQSLYLTSHCWSQWTSVFAQGEAEPCCNTSSICGVTAVRLLPAPPKPAPNLLSPSCGKKLGSREDKWRGQEWRWSKVNPCVNLQVKAGRRKGSSACSRGLWRGGGSAGEESRWGATTQIWSTCCLHTLLCKIWVEKGDASKP